MVRLMVSAGLHSVLNILQGLILLCLCANRNSQYYEKVTDPLDLSTIEKQILTGHYKTVEAFDTDMLKVFRNAEVGRCPINCLQ